MARCLCQPSTRGKSAHMQARGSGGLGVGVAWARRTKSADALDLHVTQEEPREVPDLSSRPWQNHDFCSKLTAGITVVPFPAITTVLVNVLLLDKGTLTPEPDEVHRMLLKHQGRVAKSSTTPSIAESSMQQRQQERGPRLTRKTFPKYLTVLKKASCRINDFCKLLDS